MTEHSWGWVRLPRWCFFLVGLPPYRRVAQCPSCLVLIPAGHCQDCEAAS